MDNLPVFNQGKSIYTGDLISLNDCVEDVHKARELMGQSKITDNEAQQILDAGVSEKWKQAFEGMKEVLEKNNDV